MSKSEAKHQRIQILDPTRDDVAGKSPSPDKGLSVAIKNHKAGNLVAAAKKYQDILKLDPDNLDAINLLGLTEYQRENHENACQLFERAIKLNPRQPQFYYNYANALRKLGKYRESISYHQRAIALNPDYAEAYHGVGVAYKILGKIDKAVYAYQHALAINPEYHQLYSGLANLNTQTEEDNSIELVEQKYVDPAISKSDQVYLGFALAKQYHDLGEYKKAAKYFRDANKTKRSLVKYKLASDLALVDGAMQTFSRSLLSANAGKGYRRRGPIFIVGLPRSGSTLLEQVLASHSQVYGVGEIKVLSNLFNGLLPPTGSIDVRLEKIKDLRPDDFVQIGKDYVSKASADVPREPYFTDKLLANFKYIGFIKLILPQAKVIHIRRDPLDNCFACYRQLFADGNHFTYDLEELGEYYLAYQRLMQHWHRELPGFILDVWYEDMIADLENEAGRCLDFCGLPWEEGCLRFYENSRPVNTASSTQVRKPIYTGSIGQWKRYEALLEPLINVVKQLDQSTSK